MNRPRPPWQLIGWLAIPLALTGALVVGERPRASAPVPATSVPALPRGAFRVRYGAAAAGEMRVWRKRLRTDRVLEQAAERLNAFVRLPADVTLVFDECGEDDAYYEKGRITFCYEEVADYADLLGPDSTLSESDTRRVEGAASFFLYHEAGHALVDLLDLPVTGKEEDAVDQFAVYFLAEGAGPDARGDALRAADVLGRLAHAESERKGPLPVWDIHSLDAQREANLLCWVYGADPHGFRQAVRRAGLPDERRSSCEEEYAQLAGSWEALLGPYLKRSPEAPASTADSGSRAP